MLLVRRPYNFTGVFGASAFAKRLWLGEKKRRKKLPSNTPSLSCGGLCLLTSLAGTWRDLDWRRLRRRRLCLSAYRDSESISSLVSDLNNHLASRSPRLQGQEPRLPLPSLPSAQELEAFKKVAQILITLGEQVIPAIIGEPPFLGNGPTQTQPALNVPNDHVENNTSKI
ncbi:hypothetical protein K1T71_011017 [Dendrolimus kikuchii]|uniref:Uncharacterized protein n=1 Tax=Dendrolimus kikuchii TaxID=765133 RepID=A0ACC1CQG6_9NEOP|nr:hypothetical protein K1T71_011017 [Dendrolimus kikuchii]